MTIQHTTNYGIAYADEQTPLVQLAAVTQEVAESLDGAMGRAGYTPPDATSFAALAARVTAAEGKLTPTFAPVTFANSFAQFGTAPYGEKLRAQKNAQGDIEVRGMLSVPVLATTAAVVAFTLPTGYRPPLTLIRQLIVGGVSGAASVLWRVNIDAAGVVTVQPAATTAAATTAVVDWTFRTVEPA